MATQQTDEPTIGKLVTDASRDISTLISKEIQLAKSEIKVSLKFGAAGAAFLGVAAFLLLLGVIMLSVGFAYLLHWNGDFLDLHWAFLIVFLVYTLLAGLFAFIGIKKVKHVGPPEKAINQGKQIPSALKGKA